MDRALMTTKSRPIGRQTLRLQSFALKGYSACSMRLARFDGAG